MDNKVSIYLCDDDTGFTEQTKKRIKSILAVRQRPCEIAAFSDGNELIARFEKSFADVVFLDIDMPLMTGFEAAQRLQTLKKDIHIIFITSHEDKVFQSYEFHPFWFVRKSHMADLDIVLPRLLAQIDAEREEEQGMFTLVAESKMVEIDINKVKYISSYDHDVIIKNSDDTEIQTRCRLSDAEKQLSRLCFVRVHNSVIVNCRYIARVSSREVMLHNGERINISRGRVDRVKNEFQKFMRSR